MEKGKIAGELSGHVFSPGEPMMKYKTLQLMMTALIALIMSQTANAVLPVTRIADTFSHDEGLLLDGTATEIAGRTWSSLVSHRIIGGKAEWSSVANSADVRYSAPTNRKFSIEAVASDRCVSFTLFPDVGLCPGNINVALGFADETGTHGSGINPATPPGQNISGRTGLMVTIDASGFVYLWDNAFNALPASGKTLDDVGLPRDYQGDIPMLLEMDPVNNRARAEVNNVEVYNIPYTITQEITWAGFGWAGQQHGNWDNFAVRQEVPEPTSIVLLGMGGLMLSWTRKRLFNKRCRANC